MALIRIALTGALFGVITGTIFAINMMFHSGDWVFALGQVTTILGSLVVIILCTNAAMDYEKVRGFEEYENFVMSELRKEESQRNP